MEADVARLTMPLGEALFTWYCVGFADTRHFGTSCPGKGVHERMERKQSHAPYPPAFREEAVRLVQTGDRSIAQAARDLGVHPETLRLWVRQTDINEGRRAGLTTAEREELTRLRRENRVLQEEREILKKAAAFFAAESATR